MNQETQTSWMSASTSSSIGLKRPEEAFHYRARTDQYDQYVTQLTQDSFPPLWPGVGLFLSEDPQDEASLAVRFKSGGDNGVLSTNQSVKW